MVYGESIKNKAYFVYIIGRAFEGDLISALIVNAAVLILLFLTLYIISKSFIKIATSTAAATRVKYKAKREKSHSVLGAVMLKEFRRFTSSANYMLNCGLGVIFMIAAGVFAVIKGESIRNALSVQFKGYEDLIYVAAAALVCMLISMNDTAAPSVSLEGKMLWQIRSLPVDTKTILKSKYLLQMYINIVPALFTADCVIIALRPDILTGVLTVILCVAYVVFHSIYSLFCGLHKVNLNWTNEVVPIKQGMNVMFAIFGGWALAIAIGLPYLFLGAFLSAKIYMSAVIIIILALSAAIHRFINTKGVKIFEAL